MLSHGSAVQSWFYARMEGIQKTLMHLSKYHEESFKRKSANILMNIFSEFERLYLYKGIISNNTHSGFYFCSSDVSYDVIKLLIVVKWDL